MKVKELYDYITSQLTPEEALMKLLGSSLVKYEKLKFDDQQQSVHPTLIIAMAAMDMGWLIGVKKEEGNLTGLMVGTQEYMDSFKKAPTE